MLGHQEIKKKPRNPRGDLWLQLDICEKLLESFNDLMNAEAAAAAAPEAQEASEADSGCEAPALIARHRLFDPSFRLQSKAFMLTFTVATKAPDQIF